MQTMPHIVSTIRNVVVLYVYKTLVLLLRTQAVAHDPSKSSDIVLPPDLNLKLNHVLDDVETCNASVIRRNGVVYSHAQALLQTKSFEELYYYDNTDCFLTVDVGPGNDLVRLFN